jgi:transcriptional regulator with XRE-family HTH domain
MNTSDTPPAKSGLAPSGRRFASVSEMIKSESLPDSVRTRFDELTNETRMTRVLARLRAAHGLTQQELGEKMGVTQGTISKLEGGSDESLTLADLRNYASFLDERIGVVFGKPMNAVEAIRAHALAMKAAMLKLAALASSDQEMERAVQAFFGEAFFNILDILATCHAKMPNGVQGCEIRMEIIPTPEVKQVKTTQTSDTASGLITV